MRIVTRPDFDGVVCAMLLYEALSIKHPVLWVGPEQIQKGQVDIRQGDILANLPYSPACSMWFDHHYSNRVEVPFEGDFRITPSAARLVFDYYRNRFQRDYAELVNETDKIDSANLSLNEVLHPEKHAYVLLSMTIASFDMTEEPYWNLLVELLRTQSIKEVMTHPEVQMRCENTIAQNNEYCNYLKKYTHLQGLISITDFRGLDKAPNGNRFLVYSMFPESSANVKIMHDDRNPEKIIVKVGHSIFNDTCRVNVGLMLSRFEGGGHRGAGSCSFLKNRSDEIIPQIIDTLTQNIPNEI